MIYDLIIIGGGPGGAAAAVYAGRKKLKTLLITESFGGQSVVSDDIQNWIGQKSISGAELAKNLEEHVRMQEAVEIKSGEKVKTVIKKDNAFIIETESGDVYNTRTVIMVAGSHRRKLNVPGEDKFEGKGVSYCATCDAPLFSGKIVAVVGGGNAGLESVIDLTSYAEKIYLIIRSDSMKGDPITQEKVMASDKVEIIFNANTTEILGDKFVAGLKYKDSKSGEEKELELGGVFVEIGAIPNSHIAKGLVDINDRGEIIIDHKTSATSVLGIWAAGDVTDTLYKQNNISVGDAVKAALSAYNYLLSKKK